MLQVSGECLDLGFSSHIQVIEEMGEVGQVVGQVLIPVVECGE